MTAIAADPASPAAVVTQARTRVKFCGLTRTADVEAAVDLGVDAIGLVFYPPSPRAVDLDQAAQLAAAVPAFVTLVGLFVDADAALLDAVLARVPLGALQFHGHESPQTCRRLAGDADDGFSPDLGRSQRSPQRRPWIKALPVRAGFDLGAVADQYRGVAALLLDTFDPALAGGTGRCFDWGLVQSAAARPRAPRIILAGGLAPDNVGAAIRQVQPYAVDVSGGIEAAKGQKDRAKMAAFISAVRAADPS